MGKKRIVKGKGGGLSSELQSRSFSRLPKKKMGTGIIFIKATYNNTRVSLTDKDGNMVIWNSSGALGFKGAKKGTPFAAAKVSGLVVEKAKMIGVKDVDVKIRGAGGGRESALRTINAMGLQINSIEDQTPIPHNGPRPRKVRRV